MKRILSIVLLMVGITFAASAQTRSDAASVALLKAVSTKFKAYKTLQANFTVRTENASGRLLANNPGVLYLKGVKYRMSFSGQEIFCDGTNIWTYDKKANEVTITRYDKNSSALTPQKLYSNFFESDYYSKMNPDTKLNGKPVKEVELTPIDKSQPFFKVLAYISNNSFMGARIFEKSGNRFTYITNSFKPNVAIADAMFVFDAKKYPGVEVVDLR